MTAYAIEIRGALVSIEVDTYYPPTPAKITQEWENSEPAYEGLLEWHADTGNELLDEYIDNDELNRDDIEIALEDKIKEG